VRYTIIAESDGERILNIGQHLPKLWARIKFVFFDSQGRWFCSQFDMENYFFVFI